MKKCFTFLFLFFTLGLFAQPVNDDCAGIIDLGVVPFCPDTVFFTNEDATAMDIGNDNIPGPGACGDNDITFVGNDVWFQFTTSDTITDYTITTTGITDGMGSTAMMNPQIMIYRGDCGFDELALLACGASDDGESILELDVLDLDPNEVYFIRINDWSESATPNWGSFQLCIDEIDPINTIDQNGSNACTGELYDTGGPDGDYSGGENNSFSICPPFGQNACVTFNLQYYNIEDFNDQLVFYDGPDTNSPVILSVDGGNFGVGGPNITGGGGTCLSVQASSGCLTVGFDSDGTTNFEGFCGLWECSAVACDPIEIISVDNNVSDQDIIDNISTPQTLVTIDTIICEDGAYGTFSAGDNTELGLEQGLILSSGSALDAIGPNNQGGTVTGFAAPGDADLDYLSTLSGNGSLSQDACIVEMDVFVATDELVFEYVFGSEEYPEWVNSTFNDIFAFLISGPGITGDPNIGNQENIAIIPGTTTPVEINTVNNLTNWEYYRNNEAGISVEYDGLTSDYLAIKKSLTARSQVIPCNTYHLKLAIADRGDDQLDSGVFISEIKGGTPNLSVNFASGVDYLVEDCTGMNDELLITLSNPLPDSATYDVIISGTAIEGIDYVLDIPDEVTIAPGQTQLSYPIIPLSDGLVEGSETIIITLTNNFGCGDIELTQITVDLTDAPIVDIFAGLDTAYVCVGECITMEVDGAVDYFWEPVSVVSDPSSVNPEACPATSQFLYVTGSISALPGCSDTDTIWLEVVDPQVTIVPLGDVDFCEGNSVQLQAVNNVGNTNLEWSPIDGLDANDQEIVTAEPVAGTYDYTATVTIEGCEASDDITVTVDPFDFPTLTTTDTLICQGQSVQLANNIPITTTTYLWTPNTEISPSNDVSGPIVTPSQTTTYTLEANSANGSCSQTADVNIQVIPAEVTIAPMQDTVFICLGETATLTATTTTGVVQWSPVEGLDDPTSLTVVADITESSWYFATMTVGACTVMDSVYVRVDSLPDMPIQAIPDDSPYCPGEIVTLISPTYEPLDFPDIMHQWAPGLGAESELDNLNLVITTVETVTFIRTTTNNACTQQDQITIEVVDAGDIQVAWTDTTICQGDPLTNEVFNGTDPEWSPATALSCTECASVTINALDTITYTVEINLMGCPVSTEVNVNVIPDPTAALIEDTDLCLGDFITLSGPSSNANNTYMWEASPDDSTLDPNVAQPDVSPMQTTTYSVTITNSNCNPFTDEVTISVINDPIITIDPDTTICEGESIVLNAYSTEDGGTFTWTGNAIDSFLSPTSILVSPSDTIDYTLTYSDDCGNSFSGVITVSVVEAVDIVIQSDPSPTPTDSLPQGSLVTLTADIGNQFSGGTFLWSDAQTGQTIDHTLLEVPNETVSVVYTYSDQNCTSEAAITFNVKEPEFEAPNAFTPNGDGKSDYFNIRFSTNLEIIEFKIFSRWGAMVYDNDDPLNGWNGKKDDKDMPADVYFFYVNARNPAGEIEQLKGDLTLIR